MARYSPFGQGHAVGCSPDILHRDSTIRSHHRYNTAPQASLPTSPAGALGGFGMQTSRAGRQYGSPRPEHSPEAATIRNDWVATENGQSGGTSNIPAPTGVSVRQVDGKSEVNLTWTQVKGADKYDVHNLTTGERFVRRATGGRAQTSAIVSGLKVHRTYEFTVSSVDRHNGMGQPCKPVSMTVQAPFEKPRAPAAPAPAPVAAAAPVVRGGSQGGAQTDLIECQRELTQAGNRAERAEGQLAESRKELETLRRNGSEHLQVEKAKHEQTKDKMQQEIADLKLELYHAASAQHLCTACQKGYNDNDASRSNSPRGGSKGANAVPASAKSSSDDDVLDVLNVGGPEQVIEVEVEIDESMTRKMREGTIKEVTMDLTFMKNIFAEVDVDDTGLVPRLNLRNAVGVFIEDHPEVQSLSEMIQNLDAMIVEEAEWTEIVENWLKCRSLPCRARSFSCGGIDLQFMRSVFQEADVDGTGRVTRVDLRGAVAKYIKECPQVKQLSKAVRQLENKIVDEQEWIQVVEKWLAEQREIEANAPEEGTPKRSGAWFKG